MAYLYARNKYRIEYEEKNGKDYADFMFHLRRKNDTTFILELKKDSSLMASLNGNKPFKLA